MRMEHIMYDARYAFSAFQSNFTRGQSEFGEEYIRDLSN